MPIVSNTLVGDPVTNLFGPLLWLVLLLGMALAPAFVPFVWFPWLAFVPGVLFGLHWWRSGRNRWVLVGATAWVGFGLYEFRMQAWSKTVVAPIRVDLFFVAPILLGMSVLAVVGIMRNHRTRNPRNREEGGS